MIRCPMCEGPCEYVHVMQREAPVMFFCIEPGCVAYAVPYLPSGFDVDEWQRTGELP